MFPSSLINNRSKKRTLGSHRELRYGQETNKQSTILQDVCVCLTGMSPARKDDLHSLVGTMGGSYLRDLVTQYVTHLIAEKTEGDKYQQARKYSHIEIVTPEWLEVCAAEQMRVPESKFRLSDGQSNLLLQDDVNQCDLMDDDIRTALKECLLPEKIPPNYLFSNCCFYLVGFPPMSLNISQDTVRGKTYSDFQPNDTITFDLCRLIRRCMGTIYWKIHKNISHVIVHYDCDLKIRTEVNNLCRNHPNSPSAVSPQWILTSVERQQLMDVTKFPPVRRVNTNLTVKKKDQTTVTSSQSRFATTNNVKSSIFEGRFFYISNANVQQDSFTSSHVIFSTEKVERLILSHGGRILSKEGIRILQKKKVPSKSSVNGNHPPTTDTHGNERTCYVIHLGGNFDLERIIQNDAILRHVSRQNLCKIIPVNTIWLQTCDAVSLEVPPLQYEKLLVPHPQQPMKRLNKDVVKINVAVTGFVGVERMAIRVMILAIGADYTDNMSRENTHLICKEASGPKYLKAVEWKLHVVTIEWLYHIVYFGYKMDCEKSYSIIQQKVNECERGANDVTIKSSQEH